MIRDSISSGDMPSYRQITEITGMSTSGKMSVGMCVMLNHPSSAMAIAITTKVYGLRRASRTIHISCYRREVPRVSLPRHHQLALARRTGHVLRENLAERVHRPHKGLP